MPVSVASLLAYSRTDDGRKKLRYAGVSAVFVPLGFVFNQVLGRFAFNRNYTKAVIVTAALLTVPNFFANKWFVWRETSKDRVRTQIVVFWVAAMLGLGFATLLTWLVEKAVADSSALIEGGAVFVAQLTGYGIVWVARFLVLDRWIFRATQHDGPTTDDHPRMRADLPI